MTQQPWDFFKGKFVPDEDACISIRSKVVQYGLGVFEGIRAFWHELQKQLIIVGMRQHYERLLQSQKILNITIPYNVEDLINITLELLRLNGSTCDTYIRPMSYKSDTKIGVNLKGGNDFSAYTEAFGSYYEDETDVSAMVSSVQRIPDNAIPARAKINGSYAQVALAKFQAEICGVDEAIVLTRDGHVAEFSAANLWLVRKGKLITPRVTDDILEGITRQIISIIAKQLGLEVEERQVDVSELYQADEVFGCGTACNVSACTSIDGRPVANGQMGPLTGQIRKHYFRLVRGEWPENPLSAQYLTFFDPTVRGG